MDCKEVLEQIKKMSKFDYENRMEIAKSLLYTHIVELNEQEGLDIISGALCCDFNLDEAQLNEVLFDYRRLKGIPSDNEEFTRNNYQQEILKELKAVPQYRKISAAQDFANGQMYYTFFNNDSPYIINSEGNIYKFDALEQSGVKLRNTGVTRSGFSVAGVLAYKEGRQVIAKECLEKIIEHIKKYIILQDHKLYTFLGIWTMGTYMYRLFRYYPYIWINADKGSGKTKVMEVISPICFNGMLCTNQTQATITRGVDADGSTLFIDEFENMNKDLQQGVITILNSGFSVASGKTTRSNMSPGSNFKQ